MQFAKHLRVVVTVVVLVTFLLMGKMRIFLGRESKKPGKLLLLFFTNKSPTRSVK